MTNYTMPVLSEQEREDLKKFILLSKDESVPNYPIEEIKKYMRLSMKIALAAITAEPVAYIVKGRYDKENGRDRGRLNWHGLSDSTSEDIAYYNLSATALYAAPKVAEYSEPTPLYDAPPVPVKQEGEQR